MQQYTGELRSKGNELNSMRALLEEAQMKFMKTDSELIQLQHEIKQKRDECKEMNSKVCMCVCVHLYSSEFVCVRLQHTTMNSPSNLDP